jgi:hypothetical protein
MKTYEIIYKEEMYHTFYVEANSKEEAENKLWTCPSEFDYSNGEVYDSCVVSCEEVK